MQRYKKYNIKIDDKFYVKKISWIMGILISIDQLGNAVARGNPDSTISARIGYNMRPDSQTESKYWKAMETIVNTTFRPIDGEKHCFEAYYSDRFEDFTSYKIIKTIPKILLALIVVISCIPIFLVIRILAWLFPKIKSKYVIFDELDGVEIFTIPEEGSRKDIGIAKKIIIEAMKESL